MKTVIVIDDEPMIAEGISGLIRREVQDIKLIGTFLSSTQALAFLKKTTVDIVITDIKMPHLNGIELIHEIKKTNAQTQIIIVTGFGTFEYAKQAMELGVKFIIEKPINPVILVRDLHQLVKITDDLTSFQHMQIGRAVKNQLLKINSTPLQDSTSFSFFLMDSQEAKTFHSIISKIIDRQNFLTDNYKQCTYFIVFSTTDFHLVINQLQKDSLLTGLVVYKQDTHIKEICGTFYDGVAMLNLSFYLNKPEILAVTPRQNTPPGFYSTRYKQFLLDLRQCLEVHDKKSAQAVIDHYKYVNVENNIPKEIVITEIQAIITELMLEFKLNITTSLDSLNRDIINAQSSNELLAILSTYIDQITFTTRARNGSSDIGTNLDSIIQRYYGNSNLSLTWISKNILFLNPDYLGNQYYKKTGIRFNTQLTNYRIEMAKQLLNNNFRIYEVAQKVGYDNNPEYFNHVFKKNVGMTPLNYAKHNKAVTE